MRVYPTPPSARHYGRVGGFDYRYLSFTVLEGWGYEQLAYEMGFYEIRIRDLVSWHGNLASRAIGCGYRHPQQALESRGGYLLFGQQRPMRV